MLSNMPLKALLSVNVNTTSGTVSKKCCKKTTDCKKNSDDKKENQEQDCKGKDPSSCCFVLKITSLCSTPAAIEPALVLIVKEHNSFYIDRILHSYLPSFYSPPDQA